VRYVLTTRVDTEFSGENYGRVPELFWTDLSGGRRGRGDEGGKSPMTFFNV